MSIIETYPRVRTELPESYKLIYDQHYAENREGKTKVSAVSSRLEGWLHRKVAFSADKAKSTLEIGAGTLNQLNFEEPSVVYDIVEPYDLLYKDSVLINKINNIYTDISEVPIDNRYDRITAVACFEHICNLPEVVEKCAQLLKPGGILCVSIPNEGRFLWKFAYTLTTGLEFKKRYGLKYDVLMNYEHISTADDIEAVLKYYFKNINTSLLGFGKTFSLYRYYECKIPKGLS